MVTARIIGASLRIQKVFNCLSIYCFFLQLNWTKFPCVLKAGHCHGGMATARFDNQMGLQDAAGLVSGTGFEGHCYCTIEPYIDAKFDVHIQKIGNNYKAFM